MAERLPESTRSARLEMRRWRVEDAPALHAAITENVEHLRPYMPWVDFEPLQLQDRWNLLARWHHEWEDGGDVPMAIRRNGEVVGSIGLHRRIGEDGLEIGYWVGRGHCRQGYATEAANAMVDLAFTVEGIERVEIRHDVSNIASAGVPRGLGMQDLGEVPAREDATAPADTGVQRVWRTTRDRWAAREQTAVRSAG